MSSSCSCLEDGFVLTNRYLRVSMIHGMRRHDEDDAGCSTEPTKSGMTPTVDVGGHGVAGVWELSGLGASVRSIGLRAPAPNQQ